MTTQPPSSSPATTVPEASSVRDFTAPLREPAALILLGGGAVLLLLATADLVFVVDGWVSRFGVRSARLFTDFAGPWQTGYVLLAVLLATHLRPVVRRARLITLAAVIEYVWAGFFGAITFIGSVGTDLSGVFYDHNLSAGALLENLLRRSVTLAFFGLAAAVVWRVWRGVHHVPPASAATAPASTASAPAHPGPPTQRLG